MELSTKNIDKTIRTIKRVQSGLRVDTSKKCFYCGKKIRKGWVSLLNGMGWFNNYHMKCYMKKYAPTPYQNNK